MDENERDSIGCGKLILIGCVILLGIVVIGGALEGISKAFAEIPWWGHIFLIVGFCYIIYKVYGN